MLFPPGHDVLADPPQQQRPDACFGPRRMAGTQEDALWGRTPSVSRSAGSSCIRPRRQDTADPLQYWVRHANLICAPSRQGARHASNGPALRRLMQPVG